MAAAAASVNSPPAPIWNVSRADGFSTESSYPSQCYRFGPIYVNGIAVLCSEAVSGGGGAPPSPTNPMVHLTFVNMTTGGVEAETEVAIFHTDSIDDVAIPLTQDGTSEAFDNRDPSLFYFVLQTRSHAIGFAVPKGLSAFQPAAWNTTVGRYSMSQGFRQMFSLEPSSFLLTRTLSKGHLYRARWSDGMVLWNTSDTGYLYVSEFIFAGLDPAAPTVPTNPNSPSANRPSYGPVGTLFIGQNYAASFDYATGTNLWLSSVSVSAPPMMVTTPATPFHGSKLCAFVHSYEARSACLYAAPSSWSFATGYSNRIVTITNPGASNAAVIATDFDSLYSLDYATGKLNWQSGLFSPTTNTHLNVQPPVVSGVAFFARSVGGVITAVSTSNGALIATLQCPSDRFGRPQTFQQGFGTSTGAATANTVYFVGGLDSIMAVTVTGTDSISTLSAPTAAYVQSLYSFVPATTSPGTPPVVLIAIDQYGTISAFNGETLAAIWNSTILYTNRQPEAVALGDYIYVSDGIDTITSFSLLTGQRVWIHALDLGVRRGLIAYNGSVFCRSGDSLVRLNASYSLADPLTENINNPRRVLGSPIPFLPDKRAYDSYGFSPIVVSGIIVVAVYDTLAAINVYEGRLMWNITNRGGSGSVTCTEGTLRGRTLFLNCYTFAAFDLFTGERVAIIESVAPNKALVDGSGVAVYSGQSTVFATKVVTATGSGPSPLPPSAMVAAPVGIPPTNYPNLQFRLAPTPPPGVVLPTLGCVANVRLRAPAFVACVNRIVSRAYNGALQTAVGNQIGSCTEMGNEFNVCAARYVDNMGGDCPQGVSYLGQVIAQFNASNVLAICPDQAGSSKGLFSAIPCSDGPVGLSVWCSSLRVVVPDPPPMGFGPIATPTPGAPSLPPSFHWFLPGTALPAFVRPPAFTSSPSTATPSPGGATPSPQTQSTPAPLFVDAQQFTVRYKFSSGDQPVLVTEAEVAELLQSRVLNATTPTPVRIISQVIAAEPQGDSLVVVVFSFAGPDATANAALLKAQPPNVVAAQLGAASFEADPLPPPAGQPPASGKKTAIIVGAVIAVVVGLIVIVVLCLLLKSRTQREQVVRPEDVSDMQMKMLVENE